MNPRRPVVLAIALAFAAPLAHGQAAPKRLSDWLIEQPATAAPYPLGLIWRVPEEVPAQSALRLELLDSLADSGRRVTADPQAMARLHAWLRSLAVTGRAPVAAADARWLQANPARDPVLLPGHSFVLPQRPRTVTVVMDTGARCKVPHVQGNEAKAYLAACDPDRAARADWAWIAQPDGRVQRFGVAAWNGEKQDEPAPGAWIWSPARDGGWTERFSERLIAFLATQGPAPDRRDERGSPPSPPFPPRRGKGDNSAPRQGDRETGDEKRAASREPPATSDQPRAAGGAAEGFRFSDLLGSDEAAPPHPSPLPRGEGGIKRSRGLELTASDWGNVGLLQTPTARMRNAGHFTVHFSHTRPYTHGNIFVQPFDWMEAGFRYSDISNRPYGAPELSGGQSAKDKGFDVKFRLWPESAYAPQVAIGFRDIAGTGLFSGEYLVASKRTGDLDWSLGVGWGYLAGQRRVPDTGQGGNFNFGSYFRARAKPFGGVQWQTPWEPLILKLEYEGNDYQSEPQNNNQKQSSPVNFGLVYRWARSTDFMLGVERGNKLTLGLTLHTQLDGLSTPKLNDPPRVAVAAGRPQRPPDWTATAGEIERQTDWRARGIERRGRELRVTVDDAETFYWRDHVDRAAAVLHRDAPAEVDRFVLVHRRRGVEVAEHVIDRDAWLEQQIAPVPPGAQRETVIAREAGTTEPGNPLYTASSSRFEHGLGLGYTQTIGGPDAFLLYQLSAVERAKLKLRDDTWLQGSVQARLIDNYDKFKFTGPSNLPRVRTFLREYLTSSTVTMPNLQLTHVGRLGANQYYSAYGGFLESMFAGVGGEWLYRPFASRVAVGVDANYVRQRGFDQDFSFRDYETATGHATLYWDTGWKDVLAKLSAGRYLAGDSGVTVDLSRTFRNGVTFGAFATKTNVSAQEFGEGSFDKGVYVSIPFDAMMTRTIGTTATLLWRPLTRDGGAKLFRTVALHDLTQLRDDRALKVEPAPARNDEVIPADRREAWTPEARGPEPYTRISARPSAQQWRADSSHEYRLVEALHQQEFRNIRVAYDGSARLTVTLANDRLHPISRAVGRAARTVLRLAPDDAREIRIEFSERSNPVVRYDFFDLKRLDRYFSGAIGRDELAEYVAVEYLNPAARETDPLARLDDVSTELPGITALLPETREVGRVAGDLAAAGRTAASVNWLRAGAIGAATVLASSALDRRGFEFARDHAASRWLRDGVRVGNALPWIGLAGSALVALDGSDPVRSRTGFAAAEAGATALVVASGLKYAVGRARPDAGLGRSRFDHFSSEDRFQAFPSRHAAVAWAVATPFALEYNAPWLYGIAAATNLARTGSREHWFSDTVAGSLIGYGLGRIFWESSRSRAKNAPRVTLTPQGIWVASEW